MKRAHGMAQLNFPTIRFLHETYNKMQHIQDKNKHNNATMNCNDTNNKHKENDYRKHKHPGIDAKTTPTTRIMTMTIENTNTRGSTQTKRHHSSRQATTSDRSKHRQGFYDQSQFYESFTMRTQEASCHCLSNHQMHVHPVLVHYTMWN